MKMQKEIIRETPLSVTTTDNAIFEMMIDIIALVDSDGDSSTIERLPEIKKGTRLRLLGCKLPETGYAPFRWGAGSDIVFIPVTQVRYISGNLGERYDGEYEK